MNTIWSQKVRELEARGWSLIGIAKAIGISMQSVSSIKHGRVLAPNGMAAVLLYDLHKSAQPAVGPRRRMSKRATTRSVAARQKPAA